MKKNFLAVLFALALCSPTFAQWKPAGDKIKTPWGEPVYNFDFFNRIYAV